MREDSIMGFRPAGTDLALNRSQTRFVTPAVEAAYQAWCLYDRRPAHRLAGCVAFLAWVLISAEGYMLYPQALKPTLPVIYALMVPVIVVALAAPFIPALHRGYQLMNAASLSLSSFVSTRRTGHQWLAGRAVDRPHDGHHVCAIDAAAGSVERFRVIFGACRRFQNFLKIPFAASAVMAFQIKSKHEGRQ